jgi:hypothetical protein
MNKGRKAKNGLKMFSPYILFLKTVAGKAGQERCHGRYVIACKVFKERDIANIRRRKAHIIKTL